MLGIEAVVPQRALESGGERVARRPRLLGMLEEIDDEPFRGRFSRKRDPPEVKPPSAELERARALRVVDETLGRNGGRPQSERIPTLRSGPVNNNGEPSRNARTTSLSSCVVGQSS